MTTPKTAPVSTSARRNWKEIIQIVGALLVLVATIIQKWDALWPAFLKIKTYIHQNAVPDQVPPLLYLSQSVVALVFILWFLHLFGKARNKLQSENPAPESLSTFRKFRRSWLLMWWVWLIAYAWLSSSTRIGFLSLNWRNCITDAFYAIGAFAIWNCFFVLDKESAGGDSALRRARKLAAGIGAVCILFAGLDRFFQLGHVGLICMSIYGSLPLNSLAGRLGSHSFELRRWKLLSIHLYGVVQLLYGFLGLLPAPWPSVVFSMFLALKIVTGYAGRDMLALNADGSCGLNRYLKAEALKSDAQAT